MGSVTFVVGRCYLDFEKDILQSQKKLIEIGSRAGSLIIQNVGGTLIYSGKISLVLYPTFSFISTFPSALVIYSLESNF